MYDKVWTTKKGEHIPISKMETSHIVNCINLIRRSKGWRQEYLERLELELFARSIDR